MLSCTDPPYVCYQLHCTHILIFLYKLAQRRSQRHIFLQFVPNEFSLHIIATTILSDHYNPIGPLQSSLLPTESSLLLTQSVDVHVYLTRLMFTTSAISSTVLGGANAWRSSNPTPQGLFQHQL